RQSPLLLAPGSPPSILRPAPLRECRSTHPPDARPDPCEYWRNAARRSRSKARLGTRTCRAILNVGSLLPSLTSFFHPLKLHSENRVLLRGPNCYRVERVAASDVIGFPARNAPSPHDHAAMQSTLTFVMM